MIQVDRRNAMVAQYDSILLLMSRCVDSAAANPGVRHGSSKPCCLSADSVFRYPCTLTQNKDKQAHLGVYNPNLSPGQQRVALRRRVFEPRPPCPLPASSLTLTLPSSSYLDEGTRMFSDIANFVKTVRKLGVRHVRVQVQEHISGLTERIHRFCYRCLILLQCWRQG